MPLTATRLDGETPKASSVAASAAGEALRYFVASVAALTLDAGLLWIGVSELSLPVWIAGVFSYASGLVLVYLLSIHWAFSQRVVRDVGREFLVFAALGIAGLILNSATLFVATGFGLALPIAKALSAGVGFVANFVCRKALLFSRDSLLVS